MMKIVLGAALALALQLGATDVSFAQGDAGGGDGLDKRASAQGNGRTGGMHSFQRNGARGMRMSHHRRHHRHHR
jgi:hypothetical protein